MTIVTYYRYISNGTDAKSTPSLGRPRPSLTGISTTLSTDRIKPDYQDIVNNAIEAGAEGDSSIR
jgi:hypothetical protein